MIKKTDNIKGKYAGFNRKQKIWYKKMINKFIAQLLLLLSSLDDWKDEYIDYHDEGTQRALFTTFGVGRGNAKRQQFTKYSETNLQKIP